jgi:hypothetical protein
MFLNCSTCFERHTALHQKLKNCNCSLWFYISLWLLAAAVFCSIYIMCSCEFESWNQILVYPRQWTVPSIVFIYRDITAVSTPPSNSCIPIANTETRGKISCSKFNIQTPGKYPENNLSESIVIPLFLTCWTRLERHTAHHQELKNYNCCLWFYICLWLPAATGNHKRM